MTVCQQQKSKLSDGGHLQGCSHLSLWTGITWLSLPTSRGYNWLFSKEPQ